MRFVDPLLTVVSGVSVAKTAPSPPVASSEEPVLRASPDPALPDSWIQTALNADTLTYRCYPHAPTVDPDADVPLADLTDSSDLVERAARPANWFTGMTRSLAGFTATTLFAPFENITQFRIMDWLYNSSPSKSNADTNRMLDIMRSPDFDVTHIANFTVEKGEQMLDRDPEFAAEDGWQEATLSIPVPCTGHRFGSEEDAPKFDIPGFFYRNVLAVIVSFFQTAKPGSIHFTPFEQWHQDTDGTTEREYSELYNSQAWIDEHLRIMRDFRDNPMEKVIAAIIWYSDSTLLAEFGGKAAWPIYQFFGNQSKYFRTKPSTFAAHHISYVPSVSVADPPQ
jgi:hypothetical protein